MRLLIATSNPGKLRDFAHAALNFPGTTIEPLPNLDRMAPPEETADSFAGNALLKAMAYSTLAPGEIVVADDSGLSVLKLGGAPGVRSARYADDEGWQGEGTADERNLACLLDRTGNLRYRDVSYFCSLAAVRDGVLLATGTGELQGSLIDTPRGTDGFGYDPIFDILELGQTMAQIDAETRLTISHRGRALVHLLKSLQECREAEEGTCFGCHHPISHKHVTVIAQRCRKALTLVPAGRNNQ